MKKSSKKIAVLGVLCALATVLSFMENLLPPVPFLPAGGKIGFSNIVTMFAASSMGLPSAIIIAFVKSGFAFLIRGWTAGVMSLSGGVFSTFIMWFLFKKTKASFMICGTAGALMHNFAQLFMASLITSTPIWFYIPFVLVFGSISGAVIGIMLGIIMPRVSKSLIATGYNT